MANININTGILNLNAVDVVNSIKGDSTALELLKECLSINSPSLSSKTVRVIPYNLDYTNPTTFNNPIGSVYGVLYGQSGNNLTKLENDKWITVMSPSSAPNRVYEVDDGELIVVSRRNVFKSSNLGRSNEKWNMIYELTEPSVFIAPFGSWGDGLSFAFAEYSNREQSNIVVASRDGGETTQVIYDQNILHPDEYTHIHGVAYDKYADVWIVSEGHDESKGIYVNSDPFANPLDWERVGGGSLGDGNALGGSPTIIWPLEEGIALSSDAVPMGAWIMKRSDSNPVNWSIELSKSWETGHPGIAGFGQNPAYHKRTKKILWIGQTNPSHKGSETSVPVFSSNGENSDIIFDLKDHVDLDQHSQNIITSLSAVVHDDMFISHILVIGTQQRYRVEIDL